MATASKQDKHAGGRPRMKRLCPFGKRLDALAAKRGWSRNDVAKATGINATTLWRWMVGETEPSLVGAVLIAESLNAKVSDLVPKKAG